MSRRPNVLDESTWFIPKYIEDKNKRPSLASMEEQFGQSAIFMQTWNLPTDSGEIEIVSQYRFSNVMAPCQICGKLEPQNPFVIVDSDNKVSGYFAICYSCKADINEQSKPKPMSREEFAANMLNASDVPPKMRSSRFQNFDYKLVKNGLQILNRTKEFSRTGNTDELALVLIGKTGTGKTHLAVSSMYNYLYEDRRKTCMYYKIGTMMDEIKDAIGSKGGASAVLKKLINVELLVIDEISRDSFTRYSTDKLQNLIQARIEFGVKTVICGNIDQGNLVELFGEAVISRIKGAGSVLVLDGEDYRATHKVL